MKRLLTALILLVSFNTWAFECTPENTIVHPAYKSTKVKVEPTFFPVITESLMGVSGENVKTFCIKGQMNKNTKRQTIAIVQTGEFTRAGKTSRYFFNFTDGWGLTQTMNYRKDFWWDKALPDWTIQCGRHPFTDVAQCSMFTGVLRYTRFENKQQALDVGRDPFPYSEFCVRIDKEEPICGKQNKPFRDGQAYRTMSYLAKGNQIRVQYQNQYGEVQYREYDRRTTYLAQHLTSILILHAAGEQ